MVHSCKMSSSLYCLAISAIICLSSVFGGCPPTWPGENAEVCSSQLCVKREDCDKFDLKGHCCTTECGGRNCYYPAMYTSRPSCPEPPNWIGTNLTTCDQDLCRIRKHECHENGTVGICCQTSCSGQNCFYGNLTSPGSRNDRFIPHECPIFWNGSKCNETTCHENNHCQEEGKVGFCCPTQCGERNCYWPTEEDKSEDCDGSEDCHNDKGGRSYYYNDYYDYYPHYGYYPYGRALPSEPLVCPSNWDGIVGVCGHHLCTNDTQCSAENLDGLCCETKCGGRNCFVQSLPRPRAEELVLDCPANWTGSNDSTCQDQKLCNKSTECVREENRGLCCQTTCSGRSCFYANTTRNPRTEKAKIKRTRCPEANGWPGSMPDNCKERTCSHHSSCRNSDQKGRCCTTSCGGKSCYIPGDGLPFDPSDI